MQSPALANRRAGLGQIKRASILTLIGLPEMIGLVCATILALITLFAYLYFYLPAQSRLSTAQAERDRLQAVLRSSETNLKGTTRVSEDVNKINASMSDFENNWLPVASSGRMSLYARVNGLIKSNGLRNTAGPSYTPLEQLGSKAQIQPTASAEKQSNAKWQTIYPGIAVTVTVEGPYQRVRHFIRDIETSRQFLIINAVELESVTQSGVAAEPLPATTAPRVSAVGAPRTTALAGGQGTLVSLRVEMATYFQRAETNSAAP